MTLVGKQRRAIAKRFNLSLMDARRFRLERIHNQDALQVMVNDIKRNKTQTWYFGTTKQRTNS